MYITHPTFLHKQTSLPRILVTPPSIGRKKGKNEQKKKRKKEEKNVKKLSNYTSSRIFAMETQQNEVVELRTRESIQHKASKSPINNQTDPMVKNSISSQVL